MTRQLKPGDRAQWVSTSTGEVLHTTYIARVHKTRIVLADGTRCTHKGSVIANGWGGGTPTYKVVFP